MLPIKSNHEKRNINMATRITNQATLTYQYAGTTGQAASNIATALLQEALSVAKTTLDANYRRNGELTYILTATNSGANALTNVVLSDNLGAYTPAGGTAAVYPLTYAGPAQLYINGVLSGSITPTVSATGVTFTIPTLAAGATATILYKATANTAAPIAAEAGITNTVTATATGIADASTASHTINVADYADVSIVKDMSPSTLTDGSTITYTFTLYNYGNTAATDVVLRDAFNPAPSNLTVSINGTAVPSSDYTYTAGVLTLPDTGAATTLTVPAATFTQDTTTGVVSVTPGVTTVVVTGTI